MMALYCSLNDFHPVIRRTWHLRSNSVQSDAVELMDSMAKREVEVCIVCARGLKRISPLWKLRTYAVGWINPAAKYCSKIDKQGDTHPAWNLRFSSLIDGDGQEESLTVEIHSVEPLFYREKLECNATILLKEFIANQKKADGSSNDYVELGSFQLRTPSGKPRGMVDVSIRVSQRIHSHPQHFPTNEEDEDEEEPVTAYPAHLSSKPSGRPEDFPPPNYPYALHRPPQPNYNPPPPGYPYNINPNYKPPGIRPPATGDMGFHPPRPYNNYGPVQCYNNPPESYIGLPSSGNGNGQYPAGRMQGLGVGAGALVGGAVGGLMFGEVGPSLMENGLSDAMAHFHGSTLTISTDPLF